MRHYRDLDKYNRGKTEYIRWLGAFRAPKKESGERYSLLESLLYEVENPHQVAVEPINLVDYKVGSKIYRAKIGLLVNRRSIKRKFKHDVWSEYGEDGRLHQTGKGNHFSYHAEAWTSDRPEFEGIVFKDSLDTYFQARKDIQHAVSEFLSLHPEMNVFVLNAEGKIRLIDKERLKLR